MGANTVREEAVTFIKIPLNESDNRKFSAVCVFSGNKQEVDGRWMRLPFRGRAPLALSFVPLLILAVIQWVTAVMGKELMGYHLLIAVWLAQALDLILRRFSLKTIWVYLPISSKAHRHWLRGRVIAGCLKLAVLGSCTLLVLLVPGAASAELGDWAILLCLALLVAEHFLRARGVAIHRLATDAITLRIPEGTPFHSGSPLSVPGARVPLSDLHRPDAERARTAGASSLSAVN